MTTENADEKLSEAHAMMTWAIVAAVVVVLVVAIVYAAFKLGSSTLTQVAPTTGAHVVAIDAGARVAAAAPAVVQWRAPENSDVRTVLVQPARQRIPLPPIGATRSEWQAIPATGAHVAPVDAGARVADDLSAILQLRAPEAARLVRVQPRQRTQLPPLEMSRRLSGAGGS